MDFWLARTIGVLVAAIGSTLLLAAKRRAVIRELEWAAVSSSAGLAAVDVVYVAKGRISRVYPGDVAVKPPSSASG